MRSTRIRFDQGWNNDDNQVSRGRFFFSFCILGEEENTERGDS